MEPVELKAQVKAAAKGLGADLVGIASIERFAGAPAGSKPTDIMPQAQTVIVIAKRIPLEIIKNRNLLTTYTSSFQNLFIRLDGIAFDVACFLEDLGARALPIPADDPYTRWDSENLHGMGDLSHRHAAVAAGLGTLGKNTLLLTPEFGNRVSLVSIITDLNIEPDPIIEQELCLPNCSLCIDACPAGALSSGDSVVQKLCRSQINTELPRGFSVYGCWECRRVCPVGGVPHRKSTGIS